MTRKEISSLVIVIFFGLVLQAGLIALDATPSPWKTAVSYVEARYGINPSMARYLCGDENGSCSKHESPACLNSEVDNYIYNATSEAAERGFEKSFARYALSHIETHTEYLDQKKAAVVHLTAVRRRAINPLYVFVARIFNIGETYEVDEKIHLKLEEGQWRVCEQMTSLL